MSYVERKLKAWRVAAVKRCFDEHRRRYGSRRIAKTLEIGRYEVRGIMKKEGLRAIAAKAFRPKTTDSRHGRLVSPNLLRDSLNAPSGKGEVIVGDITYLPMRDGRFCYLACFQDKFTRRIVGWKVSERMTASLVTEALNMARRRFLLKKKAIIHTDRGSQYASTEYRRLLYITGYRQSMSGKGNCYDNAQAESFFSRFKAELLEDGIFESVEQARSEIFSYIEGYYNRIRLHSGIGYRSPLQFENELKIKSKSKGAWESFLSG